MEDWDILIFQGNKHSIIIYEKHHVTDILIRHYHETYFYAATKSTFSLIRQTFWIINEGEAVRGFIFKCMKWFPTKTKVSSELMADLPVSRVVLDSVFSKLDIDFALLFLIKTSKWREWSPYVCLFVYFVKALHLKIVNDLRSKAFLASLTRLVARRGKPKKYILTEELIF